MRSWVLVADTIEQWIGMELTALVLRTTRITPDEWSKRMKDDALSSYLRSRTWIEMANELAEAIPPAPKMTVQDMLVTVGCGIDQVPLLAWMVSLSKLSKLGSRKAATDWLTGPMPARNLQVDLFIRAAMDAFYLTKLTAYAQLLEACRQECSKQVPELARRLLHEVCGSTEEDIQVASDGHLFLVPEIAMVLVNNQGTWRRLVAMGQRYGVALPLFSAALSYYDAYRSSTELTEWAAQ